jgi:hypothetical protein
VSVTTSKSSKAQVMHAQYGAWPYPRVPLLASLPSTHPFELGVDWLWDRSGSGEAPARPRIWIAGCGTFQPYALAVANPRAEIVATDLSEPSLTIARRRCLVHGQRHVRFAPVDLDDETTWPEGTFDLIECYGVLMNLADPAATLRRLRQRLTKHGVLRLMVYPHWSRARVFQLQRVAKLLGFTAADRSHPSRFRTFVKRLPKAHPLRYAFTSYHDSRNDAGVVDAFLHGGDRGFTAFQLGELLHGAGLEPAFWFHRPWARPDAMAERLEFGERSQSFVLNYLDLWQELRGNFVVCARRDDAGPREVLPLRPHPSFTNDAPSLRHRLRLERLRWFGGSLPTRTEDERIAVRRADARALQSGRPPAAGTHPLWLGGEHGSKLPAHSAFPREAEFLAHRQALRRGKLVPNPLYAHLFAAFELAQRHPELGLPDLEAQMGRWLPWADPLEAPPIAFGLTPYATLQRLRVNVAEHLARPDAEVATGYGDVRLRGDDGALAQVRRLLAVAPEVPTCRLPDETLRELFVLLCTHDRLFVTFE